MLCVPMASEAIVRLAWADPSRVTGEPGKILSWLLKLSRKVTWPVGVPVYCGFTTAVNVRACPTEEGFVPDVKVTTGLLVAWFTICEKGTELLTRKLASPL